MKTPDWLIHYRLRKSLRLLGKNVADELTFREITGKRLNAFECPIRKFLVTQGWNNPTVSAHMVSTQVDYRSVFINTPERIALFIKEFDRGDYPQLIESRE